MDPVHSLCNSFTFLTCISLEKYCETYSNVFLLTHLSWYASSISTIWPLCHLNYRWLDDLSSCQSSYELGNIFSYPTTNLHLFPPYSSLLHILGLLFFGNLPGDCHHFSVSFCMEKESHHQKDYDNILIEVQGYVILFLLPLGCWPIYDKTLS